MRCSGPPTANRAAAKSQADTSTQLYLRAEDTFYVIATRLRIPHSNGLYELQANYAKKLYHYPLAAIHHRSGRKRTSLFVSPPHYGYHVALLTIRSPLIPVIIYRKKREVHQGRPTFVSRGSSLRHRRRSAAFLKWQELTRGAM